ncbi:hypothetical protein E1264_03500 [Actinomadura sp. KC216]|uniref:hypothetical protein n=1 Tax=Actinomadura sp. KC216 TaxID=2530370 RepID=UPI0010519567|nr:hypothetical protein [Actinomadura sp. KC216]TDB90903.1 hypothetical protein E1264_03500 [Actinomadura sp. KC216]
MTEDKFSALQEKFYEQQIETNRQLSKVAEKLAEIATLLADTREEQADHEIRIRAIEKDKQDKVSPNVTSALIAAVVAVALFVAQTFVK